MMKIFLSSTYADLVDYREELERAIQRCGQMFKGMEHFGASSSTTLAYCRKAVEDSDVVVCVIGSRYGTIAENDKSYTRLEVEHAFKHEIPVMAYVMDTEKQKVLLKHVALGDEKSLLDQFIAWISDHVMVGKFTTADDLAKSVLADIPHVGVRRGAAHSSTAFRHIEQRLSSSRQQTLDVLTLTAHNMDYIYKTGTVTTDHEVRVDLPMMCPGGSGANTLYGLARLGARAAAAGLIADDQDGRRLKQDLLSVGVDVELLESVPSTETDVSGRTLVFSDSQGGRFIAVHPGVNEKWADIIRARGHEERIREAVLAARIVHLSSFTGHRERGLQERIVESLPSHSILSFTPGALYAELGLEGLIRIIRRANVIFLYENQLDTLLANSTTDRVDASSKLALKLEALYKWRLTRGIGEPLMVVVKNRTIYPIAMGVLFPQYLTIGCGCDQIDMLVPPRARANGAGTERPKDATGAGDALAAGVLFGLLRGYSIQECADFAWMMATMASSAVGGRTGLPTLDEIQKSNWLGHLIAD